MKASRSLIFSCFLALAFSHSIGAHRIRQLPSPQPPPTGTTTTSVSSQTTTPLNTPTTTTTTTPLESSTSASEKPTVTDSTSQSTQITTTKPPDVTTTTPPPQQVTPPPVPITSLSTSTDPQGVLVTVTETRIPTSTSSDPAATSTNASADDSSGLGVGPIIGMSVAGGVAVIAIIGFFVWKFTRKRFSDFDDNEAIKWPELNTHGGNPDSHPLPVHSTGRSGFDTGSEASLSRVPSPSNYSTPDVTSGGPDPYAVPPLPHLNPNQPYRDDPSAATGYYDPYRGPIPGTIENGAGDHWVGEAIPMTQMAGSAGHLSPGPHAAYGAEPMYDVGRRSPGPQAAYGGRTPSPGPQAAYGGGRASPGPQAAYSAGRMSPGPQAAYDYGRQ